MALVPWWDEEPFFYYSEQTGSGNPFHLPLKFIFGGIVMKINAARKKLFAAVLALTMVRHGR